MVERGTRLYEEERGLVARDAQCSETVFDLEMQRIFRRTWLFVAHESQIPNPGDFVASRTGTDRVIVTRSSDGSISVLLNTCRHKGMRVCRYDEGNQARFTCPYHAWTYANDGKLVNRPGDLIAVQRNKEAYRGTLDKEEWGLLSASVAVFHGAIFANWDPDAPPFVEYLGGFAPYLEALLGSAENTEVVGGIVKWRLRSNWKVCAENFIGDPLHNVSHSSTDAVGIGPGGRGAPRHGSRSLEEFVRSLRDVSLPEWGHGCVGREPYVVTEETADIYPQFYSPVGPADDAAEAQDYYRSMATRRLKELRGTTTVIGSTVVGGVFPNMSFHTQFPRTIAVWHPIGRTETEGWRWCLVDRDAPPSVKAMVRHHFMRYGGPAGMTEGDDTENWAYVTDAAQGAVARSTPFNYQARLGEECPFEGIDGAVTTGSPWTEGGHRSFYGAWQRHLDAADWQEYRASWARRNGNR